MTTTIESNSGQSNIRWNNARRKRNQSRYLIRERIKEESSSSSPPPPSSSFNFETIDCGDNENNNNKPNRNNTNTTNITTPIATTQQEDEIKSLLKAISLGGISYFSLQIFSTQSHLISKPIPTKLLSTYKIQTLCTSRFGIEYANAVLKYYKDCIEYCTMFEYALLLGEYGVARSFIDGGINPCDLMQLYRHGHFHHRHNYNYHHSSDPSLIKHENDNDILDSFERRLERVVTMVMKKLVVDFVPSSLVVYIAKKVYEMRLWSYYVKAESKPYTCTTRKEDETIHQVLENQQQEEEKVEVVQPPQKCQLCQLDERQIKRPMITFPHCNNHIFCEVCLWESLVTKLDERIDGNVVRCPICDTHDLESDHNERQKNDSMDTTVKDKSMDNTNLHPKDKSKISLCKFRSLPQYSKELKKLPKKRKQNKAIYSSWHNALAPTIGSSQDVRSDKFKRYIDLGAIHHCRTCLELGVDINMTNEYNQTPLYIACWKNHIDIVRLLLEWGADIHRCANGELSVLNVAIANGHDEIVDILNEELLSKPKDESCVSSLKEIMNIGIENHNDKRDKAKLTLLIQDKNHPGYGSFYIDNLLDEDSMISLDKLFQSIPIADATEVKKKKIDSNIPCSLRHYFCDAEGYLCDLISRNVRTVLLSTTTATTSDTNNTIYKQSQVYVFPHMRFLNYDQPGGELLPHVDLTKVDPASGRRSTHTFILYLHDCEFGGETALLKKLSESGPHAYHEVIEPAICPRRSRLLVFPHACPHQGMKVISTPKILLRGEIILS